MFTSMTTQVATHLTRDELIQSIKQKHASLQDVTLGEISAPSLKPITLDIQPTRVLRGHSSAVYHCAWASDSQKLISCGMDSSIIVQNPVKGVKLDVLQAAQPYNLAACFSGDGSKIAVGGLDCSVSIFAGGQRSKIYEHEGYVTCLGFLGMSLLSGSADRSVKIFDLQKNELRQQYAQHFRDVLTLDTQGETFATGSCDGFVRLFDLRSDSQVQILSALHSDANSVKFHPSGKQIGIATSSNKFLLYDLRNQQLLQEFSPPVQKAASKRTPEMKSFAFSSSGRVVFTATEERLSAFDVMRGDYLGEVGEHQDLIACVAVSPDGEAIATTGWDGLIKIWS